MLREFHRVLRYLPRYRGAIALGLLAIPLARAFDLYLPVLVGEGVDQLRQQANDSEASGLSRPLSHYFMIFVGLAVLKGVAKFAMRWFVVRASRRFEQDLRNDVFAHLLTLPPSYFQAARTGDLMARLTNDIEAIRMFLGPGMMYFIETLCFLPPAIIVLSTMNGLVAALMVVPLALIAITMKSFANPIHRESVIAQERLSSLSNQAQENFAGIRVVRSFAQEPRAIAGFDSASAEYRDQIVEVSKIRGLNWALLMAGRDLGMVVLLGAGSVQLIRGEITVGQFMVFSLYLGMLFWPMVALGWMIAMYQRAKASMERINAILEQAPAIEEPDEPLPIPAAPLRGAIRFRDVHFSYGDAEVLRGIDLEIEPGQVVGLTGPTGAGKSTLAALLPRLLAPTSGAIEYDGVDVRRYDREWLRRSIGFVPQEAFLFADTLRENLALSLDRDAPIDDETLWNALRTAGIEDEIRALPDGLDAVVGERGVTLSGGQRQRATIARAMVPDPRVLVLDDCLSAVDTETESRILARLTQALEGRTALLISHRVAALELADVVVVLDDGRIVQQGAPKELLERDGPYRRLHQRQRAEAELEAL